MPSARRFFVGLRPGVIYALVNIPQMYAEILLILVVSIVLLWSLDRLQRWARP